MGSSQTRDQTHVSLFGRWILYHWATREAPKKPVFKYWSYEFCDLNTMLWKTLQLEWLSGKMTFFPIGILGHPARGLVLFWRCISIWGNVEKQIDFEINSKPPHVSGQVFWAWIWLEAPQYYSTSSLGLAEPEVSWPQTCISDPSRSRCFSLSPPFETDWNSHASFGRDLHIVESL